MNIYLLQLALIPVSFVFSRPIGKRMKEIPYPLLSHTSKIKKSLSRRSFSRTNDSFKSQAKVIVWDSVSYKHSKVLRLYETNFSCVETCFLSHHCLAHFAFFKLNHILDASLQCSWNLIGSSYMILRSFLEQVVTTRRSE